MTTRPHRPRRRLQALAVLLTACVCVARTAGAQETLSPPLRARIDAVAREVLARTGVPSASVAIVHHGTLAYAQAYGWAALSPRRAALPSMRYALGSISKEFTATALLLLQDEGALSIDDPAGKWVDGLGPAAQASVRALLSHTAGVRDFWPQDYDPPRMLAPVTPAEIVATWAAQPLDFPIGSAWQYSNTGYTIAGLVAERVAGMPLYDYQSARIFRPLGMASVVDFDAGPLGPDDAVGHARYALGPARPAAKEGRGWLYSAGQLAMTASDLARWDIALIERRVLSERGYADLTGEIRLANGAGTRYALGLDVNLESGRRVLSHGGEVGGFTADHRIYPEQGIAVIVLTNEDATDASATIGKRLADILLRGDAPSDTAADTRARSVYAGLQRGHIDPTLLTDNARSYFTAQALADFAASLAPLGTPRSFELEGAGVRGGLVTRAYVATYPKRALRIVMRSTPEGRIEQYTVAAR